MRRIVPGLLLALLLMAPGLAGAASFKVLYAFGDSLSDAGNAAALSGNTFPPSPPYTGRFSNGPVAVEYLARLMDVPAAPATSGGTNFAVGGATTGTENFNFEVASPFPLPLVFETTGIRAQIAGALAAEPAFHPATTVFLVWGGPNDVFLALATDPTQVALAVAQAVQNLVIDVALLAGVGARYFLVPNMADLGATPFGASLGPVGQATLTALTQGSMPPSGPPCPSWKGSWAVREPQRFGFTNTSSFCLADPAALPACAGYVFFDNVHPTTAAHRVLGRRFADVPWEVLCAR